MEALQQLELYISAQKNVAIQFIIIGAGLLILSAVLHFAGKSDLSNGFKIGALVCGVLILAGGIAYRNTEDKLLKSQTSHQNSEAEFQQAETERMKQVVKDYPIYQLAFCAFIIVSLLVIWLVRNPRGMGLPLRLYSFSRLS